MTDTITAVDLDHIEASVAAGQVLDAPTVQALIAMARRWLEAAPVIAELKKKTAGLLSSLEDGNAPG